MKRLRREANAANVAKNATNAGDATREAKALMREVSAAIAARHGANAPDHGRSTVPGADVARQTLAEQAASGNADTMLEALLNKEKAAGRKVFDICLFGIDALRKKFAADPMALLRATDMRVLRKARATVANDGEAESLDKLLLGLLEQHLDRAKARLFIVEDAFVTNADLQAMSLLERICRERVKRYEARAKAEAAQSTGQNRPQAAQGPHAAPSNGQAKAIAGAENAMADSERLQKAVAEAFASSEELVASQAFNGEPVVGDSCAPVGEQPGDVSAGMAPDALPVDDPALVSATP
ncbi:MAG: hypothetical protein HUU29_03660 [Planctomycetaceae bacterium]|nr:hypothetical protein [Planctomycetaceae bacterium]